MDTANREYKLVTNKSNCCVLRAIVVCWSSLINRLTSAMFFSVRDVEGRPDRGSSSNDSLPFLKDDTHLATVRYGGQTLPRTSFRSAWICLASSPSFVLMKTYNLQLVLCGEAIFRQSVRVVMFRLMATHSESSWLLPTDFHLLPKDGASHWHSRRSIRKRLGDFETLLPKLFERPS